MFKRRWLESTVDDGSDEVISTRSPVRQDPKTGSHSAYIRQDKSSIEDIAFKVPGHFLLAGMTGSGKTYWVRRYYELYGKNYNRVYAIAGSAQYNSDYDFLPKQCIIDPETEVLKLYKIVKLQRNVRAKGKKHNILLIFDDIVGLVNTHRGKVGAWFDRLISAGRHIGVSCMFLTQRLTKISPTIRDNCHYIVVFRLPRNQVQELVHSYQSDFADKFEFFDAYNSGTQEQYSSMIIQMVNPYLPNVSFLRAVSETNPVRVSPLKGSTSSYRRQTQD